MLIHEGNEFLEFLDEGGEDLKITHLLEKYQIKTEQSFLYDINNDYKALLNYISELYFEEKEIPEDITEELLKNINFKNHIIIAIKRKLNNILYDDATIIFKEIVTISHLLSIGKRFDVFENYNSYNLEELRALFKEYEKNLKQLQTTDEKDFDVTFKQYTLMIEVINELCAINSMDILRKKTINPLIEVITETINLVKYNIPLKKDKINILNNILGKLLFFYSHIPYIDSTNKDCSYLIEEFTFNLEKTRDGYILSKNTNFGGEYEEEENYKIFLNSATTLICNLLYKLENDYTKNDYDLNTLMRIVSLYKKEISPYKNIKIDSIEEFKAELLNNYLYIYDKNKEGSYKQILEDFLEKEQFDSSNIHLLYQIILFSDEIENEKLIQTLEKLLNTEKFKNDYHEFLKLNICDVIIKKFIDLKSQNLDLDENLINKIVEYINTNKTASHLMAIYSKIYLTLSLYYSFYNDSSFIEKSKLFYFYYIKINGYELLENEYQKINKNILLNHGKRYISDLELENVLMSNAKCFEIGKKILDRFTTQQELKQKQNINEKLSNIITEIFTSKHLNDELLNSHIEKFISDDMFYGLTFVAVEGLCQKKCTLKDLGYEKIEIKLFDEYKLIIAYSKVYKEIFERIYEENKSYIKQNIVNLLICYIKSIPIYKDSITGLYNDEKLKTDLLNKEDEEFILVELYLENLKELNKKYGYEEVNKYFKEYAQTINNLIPTFKVTGPKLAFILKKDFEYKTLIEDIKKIELNTKNEAIKPNLVIAVSWGDKNNIIEKSTFCLNLAEENENKYYEFK